MRKPLVLSLVAGVVITLCVTLTTAPASPAPAVRGPDRLDVYTATLTRDQLPAVTKQGLDIAGQRRVGDKVQLELVLDKRQASTLRAQGFDLRLARVKGGQTVRQYAAAQAANGFDVWRSYDEAGGIRDQLYAAASKNPQLVKLEVIGRTGQGREIIAVKLTQGANEQPDGKRPAVLYSSTQHAREWISTEVNRRLMNHYIAGWRANDRAVRKLLQTTELWFLLVANPDGYQYSFDAERLWRKNLRDNDLDETITTADGVDPNRNFPRHWGYDDEGSSPIPSSGTYRGPTPGSEPETQAMAGLLDRVGFEFMVNWHSAGQWLLYTEGWQTGTTSGDDPIYYAMSGNLDAPAIPDFHPGISSDVLYVTNGEANDYAHGENGTLSWTPELSEGCEGCGFVFPDDDELVQDEFDRVFPFASSVARSAVDPDDPKTVTGIATKPFYIDTEDAYKRGNPGVQLSFTKSYGDPQTVAVLAKRSLGAVTVRYRINNGAVQTAPTTEWEGERFTPTSIYYRQMRGVVTGTDPGDSVEVWFTAGNQRSGSFTYEAVSETGNDVLVVASEDYTGASPVQTAGPHAADAYLDALASNNVASDLYDVDAAGRLAPDALGVLSHYDAVIVESGANVITRKPGRPGGNGDRLALDELLELRTYLNDGGKVAAAGDAFGLQYSMAQLYDAKGEVDCNPTPEDIDPRRCLPLYGSLFGGDTTNDVLQYWLGAYVAVQGDGADDNGDPFDVVGIDDPFDGMEWSFETNGFFPRTSYVATSGILPVDDYPQFESWPSARYDKPGGPFAPRTGDYYVYSQMADVSYKRLTREIDVPDTGGDLRFWTSYDTEPDWDFLFVEARTAGGDDWTTLPDANGHTSGNTGESCPHATSDGWRTLHPQMDYYQTQVGDVDCDPVGAGGGEWHAASGNSGGWQEWRIDLSDYAGETVEISIAYASDWSTQGLGVFVDDVTLPDGTSTSFEGGLDGWVVSGEADGSGPNVNDFVRTDAATFPVGSAISTPDSLLLGFGLEGVTESERPAVMGAVLDHLLP